MFSPPPRYYIDNIKANYKPDSVSVKHFVFTKGNHLSSLVIANEIVRATFYSAPRKGLSFALASGRVCRAVPVARARRM